jgi:lipid A 3-O-deacylase
MRLVVIWILSLLAHVASAQSISLMQGSYKDISGISVTLTGSAFYTSSHKLGDDGLDRYFDWVPEIGLTQFRDSPSGNAIYQWHVTPTLRYWIGNFCIEGGIGLSWLSDRKLGTKKLSTTFQFADHIGISYQLAKQYKVGYRIIHTSNADIRKPNPGIDIQQLYLSFLF